MRVQLMMASVFTGTLVWATDYTWNGPSGSFQNSANWSPAGIPAEADKVKFTAAGTYGVSFAGDAANVSATVGASAPGADVTFDLGGHLWQLTNNLAFSGTGTARFGGGALAVGQYGKTNSTLTVATNQKLVLDGGSNSLMGAVNVAPGGALEVNGGDHTLSWSLGLSTPPAGGASFRMTGGRLSMTNNDNLARCSLWNGARLSLEGGTLSIRYQVDINGIPSAPAVIDIYTNAALLQCPGIGFNVSRTSGGLGIVNILGGSLILSNSNCNVVNMNSTSIATTGIVNLVDGKFVAGNLTFGYTSNAVAIVRQSGGQLQVTSDTYLGKEKNTLAVLAQEGGDAWYNQLYVGGFSNGVGDVSLSGGRLAVAGSSSAIGKVAGSTGRFTQTGGELIISNTLPVAAASGTFGVYTNTGGSFWLNGALNLGNAAASLGRACFGGPSSYIKNTVTAGVVAGSTGELAVADGSLVLGGGLVLGSVSGSVGRACFSGGTNSFLGTVTVGSLGTGELAFEGGTQLGTNVQLMVGDKFGSVGSLQISGGTNLFNNIEFGSFGPANVRITGGYTWTTNRLVVAHNTGSVSRVELSGGVLAVSTIDGRDLSNTNTPGGYSEILFDGGTLQHSGYLSDFKDEMAVSFWKATLTDRGAVIDTAGGVRKISQALSNEVGFAGSFTKKGNGTLTLTSWYNAFTGRVAVEQGELAVSSGGGISLCGGVAVDPGAVLNLASAGAVRDPLTAPGTVSRIDGALCLKPGITLTNGVGATLGGFGVVTGNVVFASGSVYGRGQAAGGGALRVTGSAAFQSGVTVALTGYTVDDLRAGIPLLTASEPVLVTEKLPVTLDGASHPYWWATVSAADNTLKARLILNGTLLSVR